MGKEVSNYLKAKGEVGGEEFGFLRAEVGEADELLPPISGWEFGGDDDNSDDNDDDDWHSDLTMECSREVLPSAIEKWEKEEERRKEKMRKEQPLAVEVDTAAKKGDFARVKQLQQMETSGIVIIIIIIIENIKILIIMVIVTIQR